MAGGVNPRRGMHYNIATDTFGITLWEDESRNKAAALHLTRTYSQAVAGCRRHDYVGTREQVERFIKAVTDETE